MSRKILLLSAILVFASCNPFGNCGIEDHVGVFVELELSGVAKSVENLHIYAFDASDRLDLHKYYASSEELAVDKLYIDHGDYIIIAVLNVGEEFSPPENAETKALPNVMLSDFIVWLKQVGPQYPDIMTGMNKEVTTDDGTVHIIIEIKEGATNLKSNILRLNITTPEREMLDYPARTSYYRSNVADHNMRVVAEIYKKGTALRVHSYSEILNNSKLDLHLQPGDYDILLWLDHTPIDTDADHHYLTSSLRGVTFTEHIEYMAGLDSRQAYSIKADASVKEQPVTGVPVTMNRIFAKYRLVATDVERYKSFININDYPPMENLIVNIRYDGYFPNSHDVHTDKPNGSVGGVNYTSTLKDITQTNATIGSDYIFAASVDPNTNDPYINATITITNKENDKVITRTGVRIDYRRGHVTTVESGFLTAGIIDKGISIDTRWEGEINVYF